MEIIPAIDLLGGLVVRGIAGRRHEYQPIESSLCTDARPATVARALVNSFGFESAYVADLDAIEYPPEQREFYVSCYGAIAQAGLLPWIDAGLGDVKTAIHLRDTLHRLAIPARWIVGLESLSEPAAVAEILQVLGPENTALSLDMKAGQPLTTIDAWGGLPPLAIAEKLVSAGARRLIVLDLADVGTGGGTRTLDLCRQIREGHPTVELVAGGGVRGFSDLKALAAAGCNFALVASALHDGRLSRADVDACRLL
jgi:phosphoribosylformimino-5-aminoimidazole carboxamide ribotide isomerase